MSATETRDGALRSANSPTHKADPIRAGAPVGGFQLAGPSDLPDPRIHAYRQDLADVALAGRVIASHYAEPLERCLSAAAPLKAAPFDDAEVLAELGQGDAVRILDNSRGWAWGYAGSGKMVGYVRSEALEA